MSIEAPVRRLDETPEPTALLDAIGIDASRVRRSMPSFGPTTALPLRRSITRPLRITLGHPPADTPFAGSGRKILEAALWNARRNVRPAGPTDLLFGILADSRDPAYGAVAASAGWPDPGSG